MYISVQQLETFWEIPRRNVRIHELLGEGAYGKVYRGVVAQLRGRRGMTTVAVKMLKSKVRNSYQRPSFAHRLLVFQVMQLKKTQDIS